MCQGWDKCPRDLNRSPICPLEEGVALRYILLKLLTSSDMHCPIWRLLASCDILLNNRDMETFLPSQEVLLDSSFLEDLGD